jgi:5-hydroxyisourate hydrolase
MSAITTHVLDTSRGRAAAGVAITLERYEDGRWIRVGAGVADADGRCHSLMAPNVPLSVGIHRLTFATGAYFGALGERTFYPEVQIAFDVVDAREHYHVPLLLSPYGYSTYRGS